jgi:hypothetical protein
MNDLILYTTEDGRTQIKLRANDQTVWLTQLEMADLFDATKQNISLHLKNLFEEEELDPVATVKESLSVQIEGSREVQRPVNLYNLDAILAVGYRVRSSRGVQFRRWASTVLKDYLIKGFVLDDERLKNPDGRPDCFDEMLVSREPNVERGKRGVEVLKDFLALSQGVVGVGRSQAKPSGGGVTIEVDEDPRHPSKRISSRGPAGMKLIGVGQDSVEVGFAVVPIIVGH